MKWWVCAALVVGACNSTAAADEPRPVRVYTYKDELSTKFAGGLTEALIVLGGFMPAPEQQPVNQLSLLLGRSISAVPSNPQSIRYDIEFRDSDGATLGYISDTCRAAKFAGCFTPIVVRAKQISDAMGRKK